MRLATRVWIVSALLALLAGAVFAVLAHADAIDQEIVTEMRDFSNLREKATGLRTVTVEYLQFETARPRGQARDLMQLLAELLSERRIAATYSETAVREAFSAVRDNLRDTELQFLQLEQVRLGAANTSLEQRTIETLLSAEHGLLTSLHAAQRPLEERLAYTSMLQRYSTIGGIGLLALIGVVAMALLQRWVVLPLQAIAADIRVSGQKRQPILIHAGHAPEFTDVANSFNDAIARLASTTITRDALEARVQERTAELERSNRALAEANAELETFSYSASHDLRSPLQTVEGFSRALEEDYGGKLDAEAKDYLRRIRLAAKRMAQLIDDLLKLSRVSRAKFEAEEVDLGALVREIVADLRFRDPARDVDLVIARPVKCSGDPRLLRVMLENAVGNAWKYTSKHPRARIEFGVTDRNGEQVYFLRDDGVGFDMAFAAKLFTPFQRLHNATDYPGTGIGLATVRRIIQRHHGRVWLEGAVEAGTTLYFTLPDMPNPSPAGAESSTQNRSSGHATDPAG